MKFTRLFMGPGSVTVSWAMLLFLIAGPSLLWADAHNFKGTYRALIVTIDEYPNSHWQDLKAPVRDGDTLTSVLINKYGFSEIIRLSNSEATREAMVDALVDLLEHANTNDRILIYVSVHGSKLDATKMGYWVPHDGSENPSSWVALSTVVSLAVHSRAAHVLLIADSCFSGRLLLPQAVFKGVSDPRVKGDNWYLKQDKGRSVFGLSAGGDERVFDQGRDPVSGELLFDGHSPFTYYLLEYLNNNSALYLDANELGSYIAKGVTDWNDESATPQVKSLKVESGPGLFVFRNDLAKPGSKLTRGGIDGGYKSRKDLAKNQNDPQGVSQGLRGISAAMLIGAGASYLTYASSRRTANNMNIEGVSEEDLASYNGIRKTGNRALAAGIFATVACGASLSLSFVF